MLARFGQRAAIGAAAAPRHRRAGLAGRSRLAGRAVPPRTPDSTADDEEPDRFGVYGYDMNPERARQIVRGLNAAYHTEAEPMTGATLRAVLTDKWGAVYPIEVCLGEHFQVYLQVGADALTAAEADAADAAEGLDALGALLTEWGIADAACRAIAKHPAKRVPRAGLMLAMPVYYYPSAAGEADAAPAGPDETADAIKRALEGADGAADGRAGLTPPSDSWDVSDQMDSGWPSDWGSPDH